MTIQVEEHCPHCHKPVTITLNHVPECYATFEYLCPHCNETSKGRFVSYIPDGRALNAVPGILVH